jgi:hypothetical protein
MKWKGDFKFINTTNTNLKQQANQSVEKEKDLGIASHSQLQQDNTNKENEDDSDISSTFILTQSGQLKPRGSQDSFGFNSQPVNLDESGEKSPELKRASSTQTTFILKTPPGKGTFNKSSAGSPFANGENKL